VLTVSNAETHRVSAIDSNTNTVAATVDTGNNAARVRR
jgi:hypothetical protein